MNTIKLTLELGKLYSTYSALVSLDATNKSLPFQFSWKVDDVKEVFRKHAERYEKERTELLEKHGEKIDATQYKFTDIEAAEAYNKALKALDEISIEVEFVPMSKKMFEDVPDLQISGSALSLLRKTVISETDEVKEPTKKE